MSTVGWHTCLQSLAVVFRSVVHGFLKASTKLTKVHFKTRELVLASVAPFVKTPAFPPNLIIQWIEVGWIGATYH